MNPVLAAILDTLYLAGVPVVLALAIIRNEHRIHRHHRKQP